MEYKKHDSWKKWTKFRELDINFKQNPFVKAKETTFFPGKNEKILLNKLCDSLKNTVITPKHVTLQIFDISTNYTFDISNNKYNSTHNDACNIISKFYLRGQPIMEYW